MGSTSTRLAEGARDGLGLVAEALTLFPIPGVRPPQTPSDWADYLRQNPQYVDHKQWATALTLAEDRSILEGMDEAYQKLGGTLIRVSLSDEELIKVHEGTIWS